MKRQFTGLLDKNLKQIFVGDTVKTGMRRGDAGGWTTEKVVRARGLLWFTRKNIWQLQDLVTLERQQMQYDQELRELVK